MGDSGIAKPLLPAIATPRSHLKRKHGEVIDLTGDGENPEEYASRLPEHDDLDLPLAQRPRLEDNGEDDSESNGSFLEDFLDNLEMEPYKPSHGKLDLPQADCARLHKELRNIGADLFIDRYLMSKTMHPRSLGTAFGMNPDLDVDDDIVSLVLEAAIRRAFHKRQKLAQYNSIDDAAELLRKSRKVMVITGAGISTSLGIPDFRSKETGFYDKVRSLGYNEAEEVFDIVAFDQDPSVFYTLAGDILPDGKRFSPTHAFVRLLQDQDRLQTNYTQNIDNLEERAGIEKERLIQCHGSFATASCRKCRHQVPGHEIFADIRAKRIARCKRCSSGLAKQSSIPAVKAKKKPGKFKLRKNDWDSSSEEEDGAYDMPEPGVMKPDITFFREQLPDTFFKRFTDIDSKNVDLVIVIGTSLKVAPVSEMPHHLPVDVPHIFISREPIEHVNFDIQLLGDCDHVAFEVCRRAGWRLQHEMIPKGFAVKVAPFEGSTYRWTVVPTSKATDAKAQLPAGLPSAKKSEAKPQQPSKGVRMD